MTSKATFSTPTPDSGGDSSSPSTESGGGDLTTPDVDIIIDTGSSVSAGGPDALVIGKTGGGEWR